VCTEEDPFKVMHGYKLHLFKLDLPSQLSYPLVSHYYCTFWCFWRMPSDNIYCVLTAISDSSLLYLPFFLMFSNTVSCTQREKRNMFYSYQDNRNMIAKIHIATSFPETCIVLFRYFEKKNNIEVLPPCIF